MKYVIKTIILLLCIAYCNIIYGQIISTFAGGATGHGGYWGDGGAATAAELYSPVSLAIDKKGNLYISDGMGNRVRKVDLISGIITTVAGTGIGGYNGDGIPATSAQINGAASIALDTAGNLYIEDAYNYRIRRVDFITGLISSFAGTGILGSGGDGGPATSATLRGGGVACDTFGKVYLGDYDKVRVVNSLGIISTLAGYGLSGVTMDGVPATATYIASSQTLCTDWAGNVYIADSTFAIRKISRSTGIISRVSGTGDDIGTPYTGDGIPATTCHMITFGVKVDNFGNVYNAGYGNERVEMVDTFGIINTVAGTGINGYSGDGSPATVATLYLPKDIAFDACGNMYIADFGNKVVRKVTYPPTLTIPSISLSGTVSAYPGTSVTITATVANAGSSYLIEWMNHGIEFTTTTVPSVTYTKMPGIDTITAKVVSTATYGCYDSTISAGHVVDDGSTGLLSLSSKTGFAMFPNPAGNSLYLVSCKVITSIEIDNLFGLPIFTKNYKDSNVQIDISGLPTGIYAVKVNGVWVQKLIKE